MKISNPEGHSPVETKMNVAKKNDQTDSLNPFYSFLMQLAGYIMPSSSPDQSSELVSHPDTLNKPIKSAPLSSEIKMPQMSQLSHQDGIYTEIEPIEDSDLLKQTILSQMENNDLPIINEDITPSLQGKSSEATEVVTEAKLQTQMDESPIEWKPTSDPHVNFERQYNNDKMLSDKVDATSVPQIMKTALSPTMEMSLPFIIDDQQKKQVTGPMPIQETTKIQTQDNVVDTFKQMGYMVTNHLMQFLKNDYQATPNLVQSEVLQSKELSQQESNMEPHVELLGSSPQSLANEMCEAKIKLYPPELGHVLAKLKMGKNEAQLIIVTEDKQVKQAVESSLAQLKEHFRQSDIKLDQVSVNVRDDSFTSTDTGAHKKGRDEGFGRMLPNHLGGSNTQPTDTPEVSTVSDDKKLVDTYA